MSDKWISPECGRGYEERTVCHRASSGNCLDLPGKRCPYKANSLAQTESPADPNAVDPMINFRRRQAQKNGQLNAGQ